MELLLACLKRQHWLRFAHNAFLGTQPNRPIRPSNQPSQGRTHVPQILPNITFSGTKTRPFPK